MQIVILIAYADKSNILIYNRFMYLAVVRFPLRGPFRQDCETVGAETRAYLFVRVEYNRGGIAAATVAESASRHWASLVDWSAFHGCR